jgi:putative flippase GtrA
MHSELKKAISFALIGVLNTIAGLSLIFLFRLTTKNEIIANISAYFVGFFMSYFLNGKITFSSKVTSTKIFAKFLFAFLLSWLFNIGVVIFCLSQKVDPELSHLIGMPVFTAMFYLFSRFYVFVTYPNKSPFARV